MSAPHADAKTTRDELHECRLLVSDAERNRYTDDDIVRRTLAKGVRAAFGRWDEMGNLQLQFLQAQGMEPHHFLLDVGCGGLRLGVKAAAFMAPGHYFGLDLRAEYIDAGYEKGIVAGGLADRLPRSNLLATDRFDARPLGQLFDFSIAQSVFTHVPWNDIRVALENLAHVTRPAGWFFPTYFPLPETQPSSQTISHAPEGVKTYADRDPYHYRISDIEHACRGLPWKLRWHGQWQHPRGQHIIGLQLDA